MANNIILSNPPSNNLSFLSGLWYMCSTIPRIMHIKIIIPRNMHLGSILSLFNHASCSTHFNILKAIWSNMTITSTKMTNRNEKGNHTLSLCSHGSLSMSLWIGGFNPSSLLNRSSLLPCLRLHDWSLSFVSQVWRSVGLRDPRGLSLRLPSWPHLHLCIRGLSYF